VLSVFILSMLFNEKHKINLLVKKKNRKNEDGRFGESERGRRQNHLGRASGRCG
jgi:hypothetical protein